MVFPQNSRLYVFVLKSYQAYGRDFHLGHFACERDFFRANQTMRFLLSQSKTVPKEKFHRYHNLSHKQNVPNESPPVFECTNLYCDATKRLFIVFRITEIFL